MQIPAIDIKDVNLTLRGRLVLENINLTLHQGEFLGLIGPNGGGKTVLLKVILGLLAPDSGSIQIFGENPVNSRGLVSYVPQHARFDYDFPISVLDVVLMSRLGPKGINATYTPEDYAVAHAALAQVELDELSKRQIGKLSGGQLQRALIARAIAMEPKLLLLDEPTASLDSRIGRGIYALLDELSKRMTIVLVSHDIGVISQHITSIACLNQRLHFHNSRELTPAMIEETYGCPVELIAHGHAHRVLPHHHHEDE